ncbi:endolytic transglycosylase MltG [Paenibacillus sp.]|uniref:endolytic transglycosylase MltG n=1 Tax=Paenibacillus sp. TaxID=58172 RepID=UPI00281207ED|nr:endolytic transglycosylase MltG [Paenibacillus sp.]
MWKLLKVLLLLVVIAVGAAAGLGYYVMEQLKPAASASEVEFTIPAGTSSAEIANILEEHGLIRNALIFSAYLKYKNIGTGFQAGTYAMTPGTDIRDIIARLNAGDTVAEETIRVTIPEGFTVRQAIAALVEAGFSEEALLEVANDPGVFAAVSSGEAPMRAGQIPQSELYRFPLEGYLFPETYEFPKDVTAFDALRRIAGELDRKLAALPEGWESQLEKNGVTFHELMTIASLVEREVVADPERALVAGVIYNRIAANMPLQIDATVQYLFDEQKERLLEKDLQIESPYNTYLNAGLPPGPIASPGLASIEAALYPEASEYLFYVTKKDGTGEHYFGKTYQEHLKNIEKSKKS